MLAPSFAAMRPPPEGRGDLLPSRLKHDVRSVLPLVWEGAIGSAQLALHHHDVDPPAEFEPDRPEDADLAKAEPPMQTDRGLIGAVADDRDDLPKAAPFALLE